MAQHFDYDAERAALFLACKKMQQETNRVLGVLIQKHNNLTEISPLINFISGRAKTIVLLAEQENYIDGEIIFRSFLEAFSKYFYITHNSDDKFVSERLLEFWEILPEISDYNDSIRMQLMVGDDASMADRTLIKAILLPENEEQDIKSRYHLKSNDKPSKDIEKKLSQQWSFGAIKNIMLDKNKYKGAFAVPIHDLANDWVHASNFAHGDSIALRAILSRERKEKTWSRNSLFMHILKLSQKTSRIHLWVAILLAEFLKLEEVKKYLIINSAPHRDKFQELVKIIESEIEKNAPYDKFRTPPASE